jgi:hypothetical protein
MPAFQPLKPFTSSESSAAVSLYARAELRAEELFITFEIKGVLAPIVIPSIAPSPERRDRLWESTCFEVFFGLAGTEEYWEVNVSPSGDWNLYHFDGYRQGMKAASGMGIKNFNRNKKSESALQLSFSISLPDREPTPLDLALTAVLDGLPGDSRYWALTHVNPAPDFHVPRSRVIRLPR